MSDRFPLPGGQGEKSPPRRERAAGPLPRGCCPCIPVGVERVRNLNRLVSGSWDSPVVVEWR